MENEETMKLLTILTPTYNRAKNLPDLYESLCSQEGDFLWLIVDDGSTDETEKLIAEYQKANASVALEAFRLLGFDIHTDTVKNVLQTCAWAGRFEVVSEHPVIILDGAHNEEGMRALTASMQDLSHPRIGVFSALADKQGQEMAAMMRDASDRLYVTQFTMYRADTAAHLAVEGTVIEEDWQKALQRAEEDAGANGTVVISGSLYFISIIRDYLLNKG